jgi:hypothetical protein
LAEATLKHLVIDNGKVENIIEAPEGFQINGKLVMPEVEGVNIGDLYQDGQFTKPETEGE